MRITFVSAAMIATVVTLATLAMGPALADEASDKRDHALYLLGDSLSGAWSRNDATNSWLVSGAAFELGQARCQAPLADLTKMGAPGSSKVRINSSGPDLVEGENTLDDARAACGRIVRAGYIRDWERWAVFAMQDHAKLGQGRVDTTYFERCLTAYETMLRKGVTKDAKVSPQQIGDVKWEGTVENLRKKWCDAGLKVAQAEQDKKDAPYKKVMKGEKLRMALLYRGVFLPGGEVTDDPNRMASAKVWFIDTEPPTLCANFAQAHVLHRYEFSGDELAKTTHINTCGAPRAKDFK